MDSSVIRSLFLSAIDGELRYAESLAGNSRFDALWKLMSSPLGYITLFPVAPGAFESRGARMDGAAALFGSMVYSIDDDGEMCLVGCHIRHSVGRSTKPLAFVVDRDREYIDDELVHRLAATHEPGGFTLVDHFERRFDWDALSFLVGISDEYSSVNAELDGLDVCSDRVLALYDAERVIIDRIVGYAHYGVAQ